MRFNVRKAKIIIIGNHGSGKSRSCFSKNNQIIAQEVNSVPNGIYPCAEDTYIRKELK